MSDPKTPAISSTAAQRITEVHALVQELHVLGEIPTGPAGHLLITLGAAKFLPAHPSEVDRDDMDQDTWTDATGRVWRLSIEHGAHRDGTGRGWHWAGGFQWAPDKQPLMTSDDNRVEDVPLSYLSAIVGDLAPTGA